MSVIAIGGYQDEHYHRLSKRCQLMACDMAGVNTDYFTIMVRAAGLVAIPFSREVYDEAESVSLLSNGTADVGWMLRGQDHSMLDKVFYTLPVTGIIYGYIAREDHTEIRELLDKLEFDGYKACIWHKFQLQVYCRDQECDRWNRLKNAR
ncbi:hypothetical protein PENTCL1PPCAC_18604, partial [Pristionchus entomophagus]